MSVHFWPIRDRETSPVPARISLAANKTGFRPYPYPPLEPWADTATSTGRLMLAVLRGLADEEHDIIRTRTAERAPLKELARSYDASAATISRLEESRAKFLNFSVKGSFLPTADVKELDEVDA